MKKRLGKKLVLRKETLRDLEAVRLGQVLGGLPPPDTVEDDTCDCPPPKE